MRSRQIARRASRAALVALACAGAASSPGSAAAAAVGPKITKMWLSVEVTGIHVVRWHIQDDPYPDPRRAWVAGSGTQTLGFSMARPMHYIAWVSSGTAFSGRPLDPFVIGSTTVTRPLKGSLRRRYSWRYSDGNGCDREGGCNGVPLTRPVHHSPSCPARRVAVPIGLDLSQQQSNPFGRDLLVSWTGTGAMAPGNWDALWTNCPPDMEGIRRALTLATPPEMTFRAAIPLVSRLRRGQSLTLRAQLRRGATAIGIGIGQGCPALSGPGHQECAYTDMTLEITRYR